MSEYNNIFTQPPDTFGLEDDYIFNDFAKNLIT